MCNKVQYKDGQIKGCILFPTNPALEYSNYLAMSPGWTIGLACHLYYHRSDQLGEEKITTRLVRGREKITES